jgi:hypothetical protein
LKIRARDLNEMRDLVENRIGKIAHIKRRRRFFKRISSYRTAKDQSLGLKKREKIEGSPSVPRSTALRFDPSRVRIIHRHADGRCPSFRNLNI